MYNVSKYWSFFEVLYMYKQIYILSLYIDHTYNIFHLSLKTRVFFVAFFLFALDRCQWKQRLRRIFSSAFSAVPLSATWIFIGCTICIPRYQWFIQHGTHYTGDRRFPGILLGRNFMSTTHKSRLRSIYMYMHQYALGIDLAPEWQMYWTPAAINNFKGKTLILLFRNYRMVS